MNIKTIELINFKGIENISIDLSQHPSGGIFTLVGLNESGKTTVLQAINQFKHNTETLLPLKMEGYRPDDYNDMIPLSKRANFNDKIITKITYTLDVQDNKLLRGLMKEKLGFELAKDINTFSIASTYFFENSKFFKNMNNWDIEIRSRDASGNEKILESDEWQKAVKEIIQLLPVIHFFPTFLFDFPDRIYLEDSSIDLEKSRIYKQIVQDILDSLKLDVTIEKHIVERFKSKDSGDKRSLEHLLRSMQHQLNSIIFTQWKKIFSNIKRSLEIDVSVDSDEIGVYVQFKIIDGIETYFLKEKSTGFRWFFTFLLFTSFREHRKNSNRSVLYLFDEPASNLHPTAQTLLLKSFEKLSKKSLIIFSTHSRYMINPDWLENAYIVRNEGIIYDGNEMVNYPPTRTKISAERYKTFISSNPSESSYFQPILDVLEYAPSRLEFVPNTVMVEGKTDYYIINYFAQLHFGNEFKFSVLPGSNAASLEIPIRLYLCWGRNFTVIYDGDKAGTEAKRKMERSFGPVVTGKLYTLDDVDKTWSNTRIEKLITDSDKKSVINHVFLDNVVNKNRLNKSLQELFLKREKFAFGDKTEDNMKRLLNFIKLKLNIS